MLLELSIQNFAIIDEVNISFTKGFNVLTGETGAGKSIIIDAVGLLLGGRANRSYIGTSGDKTIIEGLFHIDEDNDISDVLEGFGIDKEPDSIILITREIFSSGRSTSRINGRTVTLNMLKELTKKLVDIHGQHEHQSLLSPENHIKLIDSLGGKKIGILKENVKNKYNEILALKNKLKKYNSDDKEKERKIDLLKFQLDEIDVANLKREEEEILFNEYNILSNSENIIETLTKVNETLNSNDYNYSSIIDQLINLGSQLRDISKHDKKLERYVEDFDAIIFTIQDLTRELRSYEENIDYNPERLNELQNRLNTINDLKRKYGNTIDEILDYRNKIYNEYQFIVNSEEEIRIINNEIEKIEKELSKICEELTLERKGISKNIEKSITKELSELNMKDVKFEVQFKKYDYYTQDGIDNVEFLISTNIGEPLKPLSKIVSGGEMSRIMLAFKNILADVDNISCLIFDEIDTGISGRTAQVLSEKISKISKTHQILCITHLPQIAAMGDSHFLINKIVKDNRTITKVKKLDYSKRVDELSRLLGGVDLTDTTRNHAKEMLEMSKQIR
ncbi:DNA repair protein RecN [Dethiothermospora halolimnae]|uniref:DNA repair protein RecN n=1 Tax=Dethiothermospora halolimnae TaxID=3114390 RepID=UPI003CCBDD0A